MSFRDCPMCKDGEEHIHLRSIVIPELHLMKQNTINRGLPVSFREDFVPASYLHRMRTEEEEEEGEEEEEEGESEANRHKYLQPKAHEVKDSVEAGPSKPARKGPKVNWAAVEKRYERIDIQKTGSRGMYEEALMRGYYAQMARFGTGGKGIPVEREIDPGGPSGTRKWKGKGKATNTGFLG